MSVNHQQYLMRTTFFLQNLESSEVAHEKLDFSSSRKRLLYMCRSCPHVEPIATYCFFFFVNGGMVYKAMLASINIIKVDQDFIYYLLTIYSMDNINICVFLYLNMY